MLLNLTRSAAERVEELVDGVKEKKIKLEGSFKIEDHLSVLNLRCIERLYDERGYEMLVGVGGGGSHIISIKAKSKGACRNSFGFEQGLGSIVC
ncbi:hypothetical protein Dsin_023843 [Dipteronia sinensis]|uniref:Uncharacterized protein n=1 Tax=Dipteronia sinensis TaxID=43782 RepID=A0AAE0A430_9ROSI|nr:hypothetical protein Dsin_023843 [Dipteronia sinensis]